MFALKGHLAYDAAQPMNSIDFTAFDGDCQGSSLRELVISPPARSPNQRLSSSFSDEADKYSHASSPVFIVISADDRCTLAARFFCTRLVHYWLWGGDSARFLVASDDFYDHRLIRYELNPALWTELVKKAIEQSLEYFDTNPKLGFAATPVSIIYADCESNGAAEAFHRLLPTDRPFLLRHIWFTDAWRTNLGSAHGYINVNLRLKGLRTSRCRGSVVCAIVTSYLSVILPCLWQVHAHEPAEGSPMDGLRSFTPIFFTRHGQSEYNLEDRLGGDPDLTPSGRVDAADVAEFFKREVVANHRLFGARTPEWDAQVGFEVWCSQLRRTRHTAEPSAAVLTNGKVRTFKSLNEIHAGICEDMTNEEVKALYPYIQTARHADKVGFRYPNGESYRDLMQRLKPLMLDLYTTRPCVLVVAHQAVLRTMLSFFGGPSVEEAVHEPCPQRAVWVCTYNRAGEPRLSQVTLPPRPDVSSAAQGASHWSGW